MCLRALLVGRDERTQFQFSLAMVRPIQASAAPGPSRWLANNATRCQRRSKI